MGAAIDLVLASAEGNASFLGEDVVGWRTALIAAAVAAIAYEATLALLRRLRPAARWVTSQIPYLVLLISWVTVSNKAWRAMHDEMRGALWDVLRDKERSPVVNWFHGLGFSLSLVFGGATRTAWELKHPIAFSRLIPAYTGFAVPGWGLALQIWLMVPTVLLVRIYVEGPIWVGILATPFVAVLSWLPVIGHVWRMAHWRNGD
ncbi:hypothetical protein [Streptomyces sp. NPDC058612]|uniref:hypothetical protein n=1 Tax=Streptomyces sp. NPDC058612 TaxID=3346555 RepID=UPI003659E940